MDTIVSILFYINVISSSGSYTMDMLNNFAEIYAPQISAVENTYGLLPSVLAEFEPEAIIVIDGTGG